MREKNPALAWPRNAQLEGLGFPAWPGRPKQLLNHEVSRSRVYNATPSDSFQPNQGCQRGDAEGADPRGRGGQFGHRRWSQGQLSMPTQT